MTADLVARPWVRRTALVVPVLPVAMVSVVLLRLLLVARPATPDEAGFLVVASQWHLGGHSLYGNYWVDRPPLLIGIFRFADLAGGLPALRVIGALAAAGTVWLLTSTARRAYGRRAAGFTAVVAAALLVSPLFGSEAVNGELLALPFLALGIRLAVEALLADDPLVARGAALGTGLTAVLALLVKQNMADVVVFAIVCWAVAWRTRRMTGRAFADLLSLAAVGGAVGGAVVLLWAMAHGTSPLGVFDATYPFRIKAVHVIAAIPGNAAHLRLSRLGVSALLSAAPLLVVALAAFGVRRSRQLPIAWALLAGSAYVFVSIMSGGGYWLHYLVEAVPVVSIAAAAVSAQAARVARMVRVLVSVVVASAVVALVITVVNPAPAPGHAVGEALAGSAQPGDTVMSAFGDADILQTTGMSSPYPYLWSLPSRTLDPDLTLLRGILSGPAAPSWIVVRGESTLGRLGAHGVRAMIDAHYRVVGTVCGRRVYLLRGLVRPELDATDTCGGTELP
jgi:hypothetical protein